MSVDLIRRFEAINARLAELERQIAELKAEQPIKVEPPKRGRPPKEKHD